MPALVDTCGWIEWLVDGPLANHFQPWLRAPEALVVPTVLQFELYKWVKRERDEVMALEVVALTEESEVVPLTSHLALTAADFALVHRLSFADALIYATSQQYGVPLVTCDDHFQGLNGVEYYAKS